MLAPVKVEVAEGRAEIIATFPAGKNTKIAGVRVLEGKASRGSFVRVFRKDKKIAETSIVSVRRFKDDVKEVAAGFEAGMVLKDFNDPQIGDALQFFKIEETG
jgi:translation initiation factor IF-2